MSILPYLSNVLISMTYINTMICRRITFCDRIRPNASVSVFVIRQTLLFAPTLRCAVPFNYELTT